VSTPFTPFSYFLGRDGTSRSCAGHVLVVYWIVCWSCACMFCHTDLSTPPLADTHHPPYRLRQPVLYQVETASAKLLELSMREGTFAFMVAFVSFVSFVLAFCFLTPSPPHPFTRSFLIPSPPLAYFLSILSIHTSHPYFPSSSTCTCVTLHVCILTMLFLSLLLIVLRPGRKGGHHPRQLRLLRSVHGVVQARREAQVAGSRQQAVGSRWQVVPSVLATRCRVAPNPES
jgi:hypothetical protein